MLKDQDKSNQELRLDPSQSVETAFTEIFTFLYGEIKKQVRYFIEDPSNPRFAHQARVKSREFRSCLSFVKPALSKKEAKEINQTLKSVANQFGDLRTLDVIIEDWEKNRTKYPQDLNKHTKLKKLLQEKRKKEEERIYKNITNGDVFDNLDYIGTWIQETTWQDDGETNVLEFSAPRLKEWYNHLIQGMKDSPMNSLKEIHPLRIENKKVRYVRYYLDPILEEDFMASLVQLKQWQDYMGAYCDAKVHVPILKEISDKYSNDELSYECGIFSGLMIGSAEKGIDWIKLQLSVE